MVRIPQDLLPFRIVSGRSQFGSSIQQAGMREYVTSPVFDIFPNYQVQAKALRKAGKHKGANNEFLQALAPFSFVPYLSSGTTTEWNADSKLQGYGGWFLTYGSTLQPFYNAAGAYAPSYASNSTSPGLIQAFGQTTPGYSSNFGFEVVFMAVLTSVFLSAH